MNQVARFAFGYKVNKKTQNHKHHANHGVMCDIVALVVYPEPYSDVTGPHCASVRLK